MTEVLHYLARRPLELENGGFRQDTADGEQLRLADELIFTGQCFIHVKRLEKPGSWEPKLFYAKREPFSY